MGLERAGRERQVMARDRDDRDTVAKHNTHSALRIEDKRVRKESKVRNIEESGGGSEDKREKKLSEVRNVEESGGGSED